MVGGTARFDPARLRGLRVAAGLTQRQLAAAAGLTPGAYAYLELGATALRPTAAAALATAMAVDADTIIAAHARAAAHRNPARP